MVGRRDRCQRDRRDPIGGLDAAEKGLAEFPAQEVVFGFADRIDVIAHRLRQLDLARFRIVLLVERVVQDFVEFVLDFDGAQDLFRAIGNVAERNDVQTAEVAFEQRDGARISALQERAV